MLERARQRRVSHALYITLGWTRMRALGMNVLADVSSPGLGSWVEGSSREQSSRNHIGFLISAVSVAVHLHILEIVRGRGYYPQ